MKAGGVQVFVHDLSDEQRVAAIHVSLTPVGAGAPLVRALPTPAPGQPWSTTLAAIPAGSYTATADAFDAGAQPLFESAASAPFLVQLGNTPQVNLFLFQRPVDPPFVTPYLSAINFLAEPKEGQAVTIVVRGAGGEGVLELSGSGDGAFAASTGDAKDPAGASIQWTPGGNGPRSILLYLEDEAGNRAAHALTVVVPAPAGSVDFSVSFNHAPYATTVATSTTSAASTEVELRTTFRDDANGQIDYVWDFSACDAAGLVFDPNGDSATGAAPRGGERVFRLEASDGQARSCVAHLALSDRGAGPAVQRQTLSIRTEYLEPACEPGLSACSGVCTDTRSDREHCGTCYNVCGLGENCEAGSCVQVCPGGLAYCDENCVDLDNDPDFCGECQTACSPDQICDSGTCACPAGWLTCGGLCIDVSTSNTHCGACDNPCTGGRTCSGGSCVCPSGQTNCGGSCVDLRQDAGNCGSCGNTCAAGQHCDGGGCACDTPGLSACGALCVDFQADPNHCGGCGPTTACATGETCESGLCVEAGCPAGQDACGPGGACVDITENASHCGGCNQACNTYDPCVNSVCMPDPEYANWPVPPDSPTNYTVSGGMVTDNVTKLMWQQAVTPGSYTWQAAIDYCKGLTFGGHSDWRLPTRIELISIVSDSKAAPATNTGIFTATAEGYWTASVSAGNSAQAWYVSFSSGGALVATKTASARARCVRYGPGYPMVKQPRYTLTGSGADAVRKDNWTSVQWQNAPPSSQADYYACGSIWVNFNRLPRRKELETIVDVRRRGPAWSSGFSGAWYGFQDYYWTSTNFGTSSNKWLVEFYIGENANAGTGNNIPTARCVK